MSFNFIILLFYHTVYVFIYLFLLYNSFIIFILASIWARNRKISASTFNTNMLRGFFGIFVEQSLIFVDKLEKIGLNGKEIELFESLSQCTMTIAYGKTKYNFGSNF